jgi:hypothetical protein
MRRPACPCMHTDAREATGNPPSAITSGTCERTNVTSKGTAHGGKSRKNVRFEPKPMIALKNLSYAPILHPTLAVKEEATDPPRWSAERRASPGAQTVKASLRGEAWAYVTGPRARFVARVS